jgi:hypothetical protein
MNIFKPMKNNMIVLACMILGVSGVSTVAIINHYPGLFQLKGPMGTELTIDGRPMTYPAKNQSLTDKALQTIKIQRHP